MNTSYTKLKETTINIPLTGTFRVYFALASDSPGQTAYGKLYKNGVELGSQKSTSSSGATFYDTVTNCAAGDKFQIYAHGIGTNTAIVTNFRICFTKAAPPSAAYVNNL